MLRVGLIGCGGMGAVPDCAKEIRHTGAGFRCADLAFAAVRGRTLSHRRDRRAGDRHRLRVLRDVGGTEAGEEVPGADGEVLHAVM